MQCILKDVQWSMRNNFFNGDQTDFGDPIMMIERHRVPEGYIFGCKNPLRTFTFWWLARTISLKSITSNGLENQD